MPNKSLEQLTQALAVELSTADFPHLWRVAKGRRDWWQTLITTDAWLTLQLNNDRVTIASDRPREMKTASTAERITVAIDRKPEASARDIVNRLLPNAREYYARCREYTKTWRAEQQDHAELLHMLEPFTTWKRTDSDGTRTEWNATRAKADIYTDRIYSLTVDSPTTDEIIKILEILKG